MNQTQRMAAGQASWGTPFRPRAVSASFQNSAMPSNPFLPARASHRLVFVAVFAIYLLLTSHLHLGTDAPSVGLIAALAVYVVLCVAPLVFYQPSFGWYHPLVFRSLVCIIPLARAFPIYAWGLSHNYALPTYGPEQLNGLLCYELIMMSLALLAYYIGFLVTPRVGTPALVFPKPRQLSVKLLLSQLVALAFFWALVVQRDGLAAHVESWGRGRSEEFSGSLVFVLLPFIQIGVAAAILYLAHYPSRCVSPLFLVCMAAALAAVFLTTGSRSSVVYAIITAWLVWTLRKRRISWSKPVAVAALALLSLVLLGNFRRSTWQGGAADWTALTDMDYLSDDLSALGDEIAERSGAMRSALPILERVPRDVAYLRGSSYIAALALPIPRMLWSDKPKQISGRVGRTFYGVVWGIPPGPIGEAYWNFGIGGIIAVYALFGIFHRMLARAFLRHANQPIAVVFYAVTLFLFCHPATNSLVNYLCMLFPLFVLMLAFGLVKRPAGRSRPYSP